MSNKLTAETSQPSAPVKPAAGFQLSIAKKPPVDPKKLEQFAAGADEHPAAPGPAPVVAKTEASAKTPGGGAPYERTRGYPMRLSESQFNRVEEVFQASTFKSKQVMGETLFMDAVEELAKKLGV